MLTGYTIKEPCIGRVFTNDFGKLTIEILEGNITLDTWYTVTKIIAPTRESLVCDRDYVRIIQEVGDTQPGNHKRGVLFVSCEKLEPEICYDWGNAKALQGNSYIGPLHKLYARIPKYLSWNGIRLKDLGYDDLECKPIRFQVQGDYVYFVVSPEEGRELSGVLDLDLSAWPFSWRGIPGWEDAYRKWLIAQRSGSRTAIRA